MDHFTVIGLGNFGGTLAVALHQLGKEVVAIELNEERAQRFRDLLPHVVIADATDADTLRALEIGSTDCAIISLGRKLEASVLATLHCAELGIGCIYAKVTTETHARLLEKVGATRAVFPEREIAQRLAHKLSAPNLIDFLPIAKGYSVEQIRTPSSLVGLTLEEAGLPGRFRVQVIAIRESEDPDSALRMPSRHTVLEDDDQLVLLGKNEDLAAVQELE